MNALVLCGGGTKGAVEVGLYRALHELKIPIDIVAGTSVGAVNGAFIAAGVPPETLETLWLRTRRRDLIRLNPALLWEGFGAVSLYSARALRRLLERHLPVRRFEELKTPLVVVATDFATGQRALLDRGDLVQALLASTAIPGLFPPVEWPDGRIMVDGALSENVPLRAAAESGASRAFCVLCDCCIDRSQPPRSFLASVGQAMYVALDRSRRTLREQAAQYGIELVLVEPQLELARGELNLKHTPKLLAEGYRQALAELRLFLAGSASDRRIAAAGPATGT